MQINPSLEQRDMVRDLMSTMRRISQLFRSKMHSVLEKEISHSSLMVMTALLRAANDGSPALRVSDIASTLWISVPGVTRVVTVLEQEGFVRREMDPEDRRVVLVSLTEAGRKAMAPAFEEVYERFHGLLDYLGEEESRRLVGLLQEVERYFGDL